MNRGVYFANTGFGWYMRSRWIEPAQRRGFTVTYDWTKGEGGNKKHTIEGILLSKVVVGIMNKSFTKKHQYKDMFYELGLASGLGYPVILYTPLPYHYPNIHLCHKERECWALVHEILEGGGGGRGGSSSLLSVHKCERAGCSEGTSFGV
jgi:hypothetical protein